MFRIGTIKAAVLLYSILAWTHFAIGRAHDHVFDITGAVDASDGTPVNDVEIVLELDKPIYDGVTPLKSQRLVTSKERLSLGVLATVRLRTTESQFGRTASKRKRSPTKYHRTHTSQFT
jgi:hypothetical protein